MTNLKAERSKFEDFVSRRYPLAGASDSDDRFEAALWEVWQARAALQEAEPERNDPVSALAIRLLVAAGHVTQEKANEAFTLACQAIESEAKRMGVELPWVGRVKEAEPAAAEGQAGWISVQDRLPELGVLVFGLTEGGALSVFCRDDGGGEGWLWAQQHWAWNLADPMGIECDDDYDVKFWCPMFAAPLPSGQKEGGKG